MWVSQVDYQRLKTREKFKSTSVESSHSRLREVIAYVRFGL